MVDTASSQPWRWPLPALALSAVAVALGLYEFARPGYIGMLQALMLQPFRTPFFDLEYLFTTTRCWREGVDVYVANPCDQLDRPMGYSPLLLRFGFLAVDRSWSGPAGLALTVLFCLSLGFLPPRRRAYDALVVGAAAFSSLVVFAVERANIDVIIFLVAITTGLVAGRSVVIRLASYGALLLVGLLKFYPLIALIVVARERLTIALSIGIVAAGAVLALYLGLHDELGRMARNIPRDSYYSDLFGAVQLPGGLSPVLHELSLRHGPRGLAAFASDNAWIITAVATAFLLAGAVGVALLVAAPASHRQRLVDLPPRQAVLLTIGAAMVGGCFFVGQSVGYRGIHLLLVLPGLLLLTEEGTPPRLRLICRSTIPATLLVLWRLHLTTIYPSGAGVEADLARASSALLLAWIATELVWWWVAAVLIGLVAGATSAHVLAWIRSWQAPVSDTASRPARAGRGYG